MKGLLQFALVLFSSAAYSQPEKPCEILNQIFKSEKLQKSLKLESSTVPLFLVTDSAEFNSCRSIEFGSHTATVIHNDSIFVRGRLYSKFRDTCLYYRIWQVKKKSSKYYLFQITKLCSSLECDVLVRKSGNSYKVVKIDSYVL